MVGVAVSASADQGIYSVQLYVDGQPSGVPDTTPVGLAASPIGPASTSRRPSATVSPSELNTDENEVDWQFVEAAQVPPGPWTRVVTTGQVFWR